MIVHLLSSPPPKEASQQSPYKERPPPPSLNLTKQPAHARMRPSPAVRAPETNLAAKANGKGSLRRTSQLSHQKPSGNRKETELSAAVLSGEKTIEKGRGSQGRKQPGEPLVWAVRDLGTKAETGSGAAGALMEGKLGLWKQSRGEAVSDDLGIERGPQMQAE